MLTAYRWLRNLSHIGCVLGAVSGTLLPAGAQFIPDKGVKVQHLKARKEGPGFDRSYWLNDHELVYVQQRTGADEQYCRLDITTHKEQALVGLTKTVRTTTDAHGWLPPIFPSPDRKYLAWVGANDHSETALMVATIEGSILINKPSKTTDIQYLSWSADSQGCFGFLEVQGPEYKDYENINFFDGLMSVSIKAPSVVKKYPITSESELAGRRGYIIGTLGSPPLQLPDFRFANEKNILLVSALPGKLRGEIQFAEYNLPNTATPVSTRILHLPAFGEVEYAVFSPQGDAIVWKFHQMDDAFWISDKDGGHMRRLGKFAPDHKYTPRFISPDPDNMTWLPSGKGISFLEEGGLCVVYLDALKDAR